jgi:hypothetical protein
MAEDWKIQVNYKNPDGSLINVRASTADELSVLLEGVGDYATQIAATGRLLTGVGIAAPLSTSPSTPSTGAPPYSAPPQAQAPSGMVAAPVQGGPTCQHGPRKYKSGISSKTGNPYAMWVCPMPQGADQCKPVN